MQVIAKSGNPIDVTYQAVKSTTGLIDVVAKIYDETRVQDLINFPNLTLTEIGSTGKYYSSFTPDAVGVWTVMVDSVTKTGPVVETIIVTAQDLDSIAATVAALENLSAAQVQAIVDGSESTLLSAIADVAQPAMLG